MPIDTILKAIVESYHDRHLDFLTIEIWGELFDHYARPLPRGVQLIALPFTVPVSKI